MFAHLSGQIQLFPLAARHHGHHRVGRPAQPDGAQNRLDALQLDAAQLTHELQVFACRQPDRCDIELGDKRRTADELASAHNVPVDGDVAGDARACAVRAAQPVRNRRQETGLASTTNTVNIWVI